MFLFKGLCHLRSCSFCFWSFNTMMRSFCSITQWGTSLSISQLCKKAKACFFCMFSIDLLIIIDHSWFLPYMNLMAGHWCLIIHQSNPKACVDVKNGQLKAIKTALRLSQHHVHILMFEVGFHFWSLTTTKPIVTKALIYLGHRCPK